MGNCEEIRCALNAIERPLSNCRTYKANPLEQSIYIGGLLFLLVSVVILLKRCIHVYAVG